MELENYIDSDAKVSKTKGLGSRMKNGLVKILAVGAVLSSSGCLSTYGKHVARNLAYTSMQQAVVSEVRNSVEGPRGTTVNVGETNYNANKNLSKRELVVQYWKDFNGNEKLDKGENLGKVEGSVNLDEYGLRVELTNLSQLPVTYFVLDSNGNKISQTIQKKPMFWYTGGYFGDWINILNRVSKEKPGEYTIYAQQEGCNEILKQTINITRDSVGLPDGIASSIE